MKKTNFAVQGLTSRSSTPSTSVVPYSTDPKMSEARPTVRAAGGEDARSQRLDELNKLTQGGLHVRNRFVTKDGKLLTIPTTGASSYIICTHE